MRSKIDAENTDLPLPLGLPRAFRSDWPLRRKAADELLMRGSAACRESSLLRVLRARVLKRLIAERRAAECSR